MKKKGQLSTLPPTIIGLVIAVIILVIGLVIVQELYDTDTIQQSQTGKKTNETLTTVTEAGENFAVSTLCGVKCGTVSDVRNTTSGTAIPSTNYTQTNCNIKFTSGNSLGVNNSNWNITYSYTYGEATVCSSANESLVGLGTFSDFIPIIVLAIVAAIVIGIIFFSMSSRMAKR